MPLSILGPLPGGVEKVDTRRELQVASNGEVSFGMIEPDRDVALKVLPQAFTEA